MGNLGQDAAGGDVVDKRPCWRLIRMIFGIAFKTSCAICSWFKFAAVRTNARTSELRIASTSSLIPANVLVLRDQDPLPLANDR